MTKLEQRVPFLATTASITPFIGLFGTVWGIMSAFQSIGTAGLDEPAGGRARHRGSADRDRSRALRRHPGGLFLQSLHEPREALRAEMDDFSLEFLNISERNFT